MNDLIEFLIKYQKKNNRAPKIIDLATHSLSLTIITMYYKNKPK